MTIEIPEEPSSTALKSPEPIVDTKEPETSSSAPQPTENEPPKDISARVDLMKYLTFGLNAFDEGRYDKAVDYLRQYLDKYPNDVEPLFALGRAYYHLSRYQDAEQTLSKLVSIKDDHAGAYYYLGKISLNSQVYSLSDQEHRSEAAIQRFEKAISLDPKYAAAYNDLGKMYFDESKYEKALSNFEKAVENETANKIYLYNAGRGSFAINNYNKTIDYCLKAAKLDPTFCYPYWFVAKSYSLLEKWSEAALYWAKAVDLFSFDKRLQAEALRELSEAESHLK
jgi:superkiller protein 3